MSTNVKGIGIGAATIAAVIYLAGCATGGEKRAAQGDPNAQFLTETAHDSTAELSVSRLAQERAQNPRVREYAQMIVSDHSQGNSELAQLGKQKGMDLPMRPDEAHAKTAAHLRQLQGRQFDEEYMSLMVADHAKLLAKFQDKAARSQDPEVRSWASSQVPVLQRHLDLAREINRSLGGGATLTAGAQTAGARSGQ
jgi:putative membrane protein